MSTLKGPEHLQDLLAQVSAEYVRLSSEAAELRGLDSPASRSPIGVTFISDADPGLRSPRPSLVPKDKPKALVPAATRESFHIGGGSADTLQNEGSTVARKMYAEPESKTCSESIRTAETDVHFSFSVVPGRESVPPKDSKKTSSRVMVGRGLAKRLSVRTQLWHAGLDTTMKSRLVLNPEHNKFLLKWDILTATAMIFVTLAVPVHVAMCESKYDGYFVVSTIIDLVFLVDLVLQFFIMYKKRTGSGFVWVVSHREIVRHYIRSWFVVDLVSIIPVQVFTMASRTGNVTTLSLLKGVRVLRLMKLTRLLRSARLLERYEMRMSISYGKMALIKCFVCLFIVTHWLGCLWALTLRLVEERDCIPRWIDSFAEQEANVINKTKDTPWKLYVACLYFTSYTITSVGYGDIGPKNITERVVCIVMIFVAGIAWAVLLGQVCGIIANLAIEDAVFRSRMDDLNKMISDRGINPELQRRLRSFFLANKVAQRFGRHREVFLALSVGLQGEVALDINHRWVSKVTFFNTLIAESSDNYKIKSFLVELNLRLELRVFAQGETFSTAHELCILARGIASQSCNRIHRSGSVWGTDFLICERALLKPYLCFALGYVELQTLARSSFFDVLESHGSTCPGLAARVRRDVCWLATQRAIMREAYRRRRNKNRTPQRPLQLEEGGAGHVDGVRGSSAEEPPAPTESHELHVFVL